MRNLLPFLRLVILVKAGRPSRFVARRTIKLKLNPTSRGSGASQDGLKAEEFGIKKKKKEEKRMRLEEAVDLLHVIFSIILPHSTKSVCKGWREPKEEVCCMSQGNPFHLKYLLKRHRALKGEVCCTSHGGPFR